MRHANGQTVTEGLIIASIVYNSVETLTLDDIKQQLALFTADDGVVGQELSILNEDRFSALKPLARRVFTACASSAASERVFSRAGLIMRPNRSRLSKANLAKLVFLNCNIDKLQLSA